MGLTITGNKITGGAKAKVVNSLPDKGNSNSIYLVPNSTTGDNRYDEYIWIKDTEHPDGYFEKVGQRDINLSSYVTKDYLTDNNFIKVNQEGQLIPIQPNTAIKRITVGTDNAMYDIIYSTTTPDALSSNALVIAIPDNGALMLSSSGGNSKAITTDLDLPVSTQSWSAYSLDGYKIQTICRQNIVFDNQSGTIIKSYPYEPDQPSIMFINESDIKKRGINIYPNGLRKYTFNNDNTDKVGLSIKQSTYNSIALKNTMSGSIIFKDHTELTNATIHMGTLGNINFSDINASSDDPNFIRADTTDAKISTFPVISTVFNTDGKLTSVPNTAKINELLKTKADTTTTDALGATINHITETIGESYYTKKDVNSKLDTKVDKVEGKGLSSNDFDNTSKNQLQQLYSSAKTSVDNPTISTDSIKTIFHSLGSSTPATTITYPAATTTTAGVMSASDKVKVNSIDILADTINHVTDTISSSYYSKTDIDKKLELEAKANITSLENTKEELNTKIDQSLSNKADKLKVSTTADGLMSKEDKILFDKFKSVPALSHINDNNAFTASQTGATLNYTCYDYTQWGLNGTSHNTQLPVASSSQAGIITVVDKQKLDNFEESLSNNEITEIGGSVIASDNISVDSRINNLQTQVDKNTKAIEKLSPKEQLFIDLWNSACGSNGKYNTETGYYELNGLTDITYDEALEIYNNSANPYMKKVSVTQRTNLVRCFDGFWYALNIGQIAYGALKLKRFHMPSYNVTLASAAFYSCVALETIINTFTLQGESLHMFENCENLQNIHVNTAISLSFSDSPLITYDSLNFIVENSTPTKAIVITLHPTTYSYLTGKTAPTTQVGGTTEEWQALVTAATAKKISFATTN